jgi:hypothetical protein
MTTWTLLITVYAGAAFFGARGWRHGSCLVRYWATRTAA